MCLDLLCFLSFFLFFSWVCYKDWNTMPFLGFFILFVWGETATSVNGSCACDVCPPSILRFALHLPFQVQILYLCISFCFWSISVQQVYKGVLPVYTICAPLWTMVFFATVTGMIVANHALFVCTFKDIDDYFSKQREWAAEYSKAAKEASQVRNNIHVVLSFSFCWLFSRGSFLICLPILC